MLQLAGFDYARSTVGHWETGHVSMPLDDPEFVEALAKVLKLDTLTILELSGYQIHTRHTLDGERVARLVDNLPEEKRKLAIRLVEQLIE